MDNVLSCYDIDCIDSGSENEHMIPVSARTNNLIVENFK